MTYLLSPRAVRERAAKIFERTREERGHFRFHSEKFEPVIDYVMTVIQRNYPSLQIPFHSRWGHFAVGGKNRVGEWLAQLAPMDKRELARTKLDLVITSVLLDAGSGPRWKYTEPRNPQPLSRSEGLAVASLVMFGAGRMGGDQKHPRADANVLANLTPQDVEEFFQVSQQNPLVGVAGRVELLRSLGRAVSSFPHGRPGGILDQVVERYGRSVPASGILRAVLEGFGSIWPGRIQAGSATLGDVWAHSELAVGDNWEGLIPFHKLSQWMTYSLIEPIVEAGCEVTDVEELTGLAEYRNGGLLLDRGLLSLSRSDAAQKSWRPDSDLIIEWRALTVHLLDQIGGAVQRRLGRSPQEFPLAKVLEGGTWWAGRQAALELRADGSPPLKIESDGTVF